MSACTIEGPEYNEHITNEKLITVFLLCEKSQVMKAENETTDFLIHT